MNPETGSFTSMDTYRGNAYDPASLHRYTYAQNNPQMYNDPSGHMIAVISMAINATCTQFVRNFDYFKVLGMFGGAMGVIINNVLGGENKLRPEEALIYGFVGTVGFALAYSFGLVVALVYEVQATYHLFWGVYFSVEAIIEVALAVINGATGNIKASALYTFIAVMTFAFAYMEFGASGIIKASGSKGTVTYKTKAAQPTTTPQAKVRQGEIAVIGKMKDLNNSKNVVYGEFKVADFLPDKGNPKANWKQNSGILRSIMNERIPVKDVSPFPMENAGFLGAERNLLQSKGWYYCDGYWYISR